MRSIISIFLFLISSLLSFGQEAPAISQLKSTLKDVTDSLKVHIYCDLCFEYRFISQDSSIIYGNRGLALAKKINYANGVAQASNDLGIIYSDKLEIIKADSLYRSALRVWGGLGDSTRIAAMYNKLGILYQSIGKLDSAAHFQFNSLKIYEALGMEKGKAQALNNIAIIFSNKGDYERSLKYNEEALEIRKKLNDTPGIGSSLVNIGNIYYHQSQLLQAIENYQSALPNLVPINARNLLSGLYNNLGGAYLDLHQLDSSRKYILKAITIRQEIGDAKGLISSYHNLGKLDMIEGNYFQAKKSLETALEYAEKYHVYSSLVEIHRLYVDLAAAINNYPEALNHSLKYSEYKDSVLNQNSNKLIAELEAIYETEKKEQQITLQNAQLSEQHAENQKKLIMIWALVFVMALLVIIMVLLRSRARKKQDLIQKEAEIKLQEALLSSAISSQEGERKRFARDLHDGFGQMISVLNLNLRSLEKGASDREAIFENSSQVLDEMYKELKSICFNLMPETLIKNGVPDALREFASRINLADKVFVRVDAFGLESRLPDLLEINIYRISQEWINNVIKYSDATTIDLQLTKDESEITLLIEDNGSGFDKELLMKGKGNGWKNMQSRSNLMKGELELDTTPGTKGNTLILNVPIEISANQTVVAG